MRNVRSLFQEKHTELVKKLIFFVCICFVTLLNSAEVAQAETKLQVIMCADTNDKTIGPGVGIDIDHIRGAFVENVPQHLYKLHILEGDNATAQKIGDKIRSVPIDSDDTLVFIFSGHGAFETTQHGHLITLSNRDVFRRSDLLKEMQSRGAKLDVLITDTCSNFLHFDVTSPSPNGIQKLKPLFHELFFKPSGLVDISATKPGQLAACSSAGSAFIRGFSQTLNDAERRISWAQVITETNKHVSNDRWFEKVKLDQTAYAVSPLPKPSSNTVPPRQRFWLGAYAQAYSGGGVEITKVVANSPASRIRDGNNNSMRLVPYRDIVTHVNGRAVNNNDQFIAAIRASGKIAKLRVYDMQTRQAGIYSAYLTPLR